MEAHLTSLPTSILRIADLATRKPTSFDLTPDAAERDQIAQALGITSVKKLRFYGEIAPLGRSDWDLKGTLGATVVQPCVVTLDPVTSRIDEAVVRRYLADFEQPSEEDVEMTADENAEELPATLDLYQVLIESLSLSLPAYPRAPDADLNQSVFTEPGQEAMTDESAKPFAGLAELRDSLKKKGDD